MTHSTRNLSLAAAALLVTAGSASAQFTETFDTLNLGQLDGQGGWHGWDGNNTIFANVVNTQDHTSGSGQSAELAAGADSVTEFTQFTSGRWTISGWAFFPTGFTGKTYFIVMNDYQDMGPYQWAAQMGFNGDNGRMECDCGSTTPVQRPLVTNQWIDFRYEVDLDLDTVDVYYNTAASPNAIATYMWSTGALGGDNFATLAIEAFDLYPDAVSTNPSPMYFDDLRIEPGGPPPSGVPVCFGDGSGSPCPCNNESPPGGGAGCLNTVNVGAILTAGGAPDTTNDTLTLTADNVINQPGLFFQGNNTIQGGNGTTFGDGIRCCGGSVVRIQVVNPPGTSSPATAQMTETATTNGPAGTITAGDKKCYQYWYRDPAGGGVCGGAFNLSNAVTVTWF